MTIHRTPPPPLLLLLVTVALGGALPHPASAGSVGQPVGSPGYLIELNEFGYRTPCVPIPGTDACAPYDTHVTAIAAGNSHTLSLRSDGTVTAAGSNYSGQTDVPPLLSGVKAIAAGSSHSVALLSNGHVVAWGDNLRGQRDVPAGLEGVVAIAAGGLFTLALKSDGHVVAWGDNYSKQSTVPPDLEGVIAIAAGGRHALALKADGKVVCWGANDVGIGQCNVPSWLNMSGVYATAIAAGSDHSVALLSDGQVVAWGWNYYGQTTLPSGLTHVKAIAAGGEKTVALKSDGSIIAWGRLDRYYPDRDEWSWRPYDGGATAIAAGRDTLVALAPQSAMTAFGRNADGERDFPVDSGPLQLPPMVAAVTAGADFVLALRTDGTVRAWGADAYGQAEPPDTLSAGVVAVAAGALHGLALKDDGTVVSWGSSLYGQAVVPEGLSAVKAIAAGYLFSMALKADGTVVVWGCDNMGTPMTVPEGLSQVKSIAGGNGFALALRADGTVVAWGDPGDPALSVPAGLAGVMAIGAGNGHALALKSDGTLSTWGFSTSVPNGLGKVVAIASGRDHQLALEDGGKVVAWGANYDGQSDVPPGAVGVTGLGAGQRVSLVIGSPWPGDVMPPTITGTGRTSDGKNYPMQALTNQSVSVLFTCDDRGGSGVVACSGDKTFNKDGFDYTAGYARDAAGNIARNLFTVLIDKTAPTLAPTLSASPVLFGSTVTASANANDPLVNGYASGVVNQECGVVSTNQAGPQTVTCKASDRAGNVGSLTVPYVVRFNVSEPTPWLPSDTPGVTGWQFRLPGAGGTPIPDDVAMSLVCVKVTLTGTPSVCAMYDSNEDVFRASLRTPRGQRLRPATLTIEATVKRTQVAFYTKQLSTLP